jgi:hypothetical protein
MCLLPLAAVQLELDFSEPIPSRIELFLADATTRIDEFVDEHRDDPAAGFVPSDYGLVYRGLRALRDGMPALMAGELFCEWGSGLGIVASMAAMLGFDAIGIELEPRLANASQTLINAHRLPVRVIQGSFIPDHLQIQDELELSEADMTLTGDGPAAYEELGLEPDDFDCIFAYPWPGEDHVIASLFDRCAARGAILMTYHGQDGLMLRRKK